MKLEEIKKEIVKASSMEISELVLEFKKASQFSNGLFNRILDNDEKSEITASDLQAAFNFEIKSLIYENELEDRLEKSKKTIEFYIELEKKNENLNAEIKLLRQKIADMQKPNLQEGENN